MKRYILRLLTLFIISLGLYNFAYPPAPGSSANKTAMYFADRYSITDVPVAPTSQVLNDLEYTRNTAERFSDLNKIRANNLLSDASSGFGDAVPRIKLLRVEKRAGPEATTINLRGATLFIPAGALSSPRRLSITALGSTDLPPLDPGLINVTNEYQGYRFLPHGSHFKKAVTVSMEYDETKIPAGYTARDVVTFFFDEKASHWIPLDKVSVDEIGKKIVSMTTHFTDMINGILMVPESPETQAYTPNAMSGIQMADPASEIVTIAPPTANSTGAAVLDYPIKLPAGRNGMTPELSIQYNSSGANGWLGLGWNLTSPSISIETRWGVPRYNHDFETETYTLGGEQLSPVAHRADAVGRTGEKQFYPRVDNDFQKIIRHGSDPKNYWWEVTDKSGVRRYFGGAPGTGVHTEAVLTDDDGNIGYWGLAEVRDPHENFIRYHYAKVMDPGVENGYPGYNLYVSSITYTGAGNTEGKFTVAFTRDRELGETKRKDVMINARLGFEQVTADLLRKIAVRYNGQDIRSYELQYIEGAFFRPLLRYIQEFDAAGNLFTGHEFAYFNDVKDNNGNYHPLAAPEDWDPRSDFVRGDFLAPIPGYGDSASALSGNKSIGGGFSAAITVGENDGELYDKNNTGGVTFGFDVASNEGMLAMVDINGDGLPDKVFKKGGVLSYRPNQSATNNNTQFGDPRPILGIGDFNRGLTYSGNIGLESNFVVYAGFTYTHKEDVTMVYFSDVNGDQLMDIVNNGVVYFNHLEADGNPHFTTSSGDTPSPISAAAGINAGLVENNPQDLEKDIDNYPLHDVVKLWVAPFNGTVNINAPVALIQDNSPEAQAYNKADGVRVAIQYKGSELWSDRIEAGDFATRIPTGVNAVNVQAGDHIYFRVQSVFDGAYDQVSWTPVISYSQHTPGLNDANGLPIYQFSSDKDFLISAPLSMGASFAGTIHIQGDFTKPVTSDSVTVRLIKQSGGSFTTLIEEQYAGPDVVILPVSLDEDVVRADKLFFSVSSNTNIDWTSLHWKPYIYYTASADPEVPQVIDAYGNPMIHYNPTVNFQAFNKTLVPSLAWTSPVMDTFSIKPKLSLGPNFENGKIIFSIKRENELIAEQIIPVVNGALGAHPAIDTIFNEGDHIFFEYHTTNDIIASAITSVDVTVDADPGDPETVQGGLHTFDHSYIFGPLYRHWGQFAYNGNRDRADQPILESDVQMDPSLVNATPIDLSNAQSAEEMTEMFDAGGGNQPSKEKFIYLAPDNEHENWIGYDNYTYVSKTVISSSRMGKDDILPINPIAEANPQSAMGAVGIHKVASTDDVSLGVGYPEVAGGDLATGSTRYKYDFADMNGDAYPDVLSTDNIQYTHPYGGLESDFHHFAIGDPAYVTHFSAGFNLGGKLNNSSDQNSKSAPNGANANDAGTQSKVMPGLTGQFNYNQDNTEFAFIDINGDGLPDRVYKDGEVMLNIGYDFRPKVNWGTSGILAGGDAFTFGAGISINIKDYSITAGVSISRTESVPKQALLDLNGDGLPDYVVTNNPLIVRLNTGTGFAAPIPWVGSQEFDRGHSTGQALNVAFTVGIELIPIAPVVKLCINPQITFGLGADQTTVQFDDIDGDGYPDHLWSDKDDKLIVSRSTIKRTNMLKSVKRPLGGSFALEYARTGNTYEQPNSVWTLSRVDLRDGLPGDGPDIVSKSFSYQNGLYNRHEREFYGFGKVTTNDLDTDHGNIVYRSTVDEYYNDNFYDKGLLKSTVIMDGDGNKFTETIHTVELKDLFTGVVLSDAASNSDDGAAFPALIKTEKRFYEGQGAPGKSTSMTYAYDMHGNISGYTDFGDAGSDDDVTTAISYHSLAANYIMNVPSSVTVTGDGQVYRHRSSDINNTGNITELRQHLASGQVAKYNMDYDSYGNMTHIERPENATHQRLSYDYQYDDEVQTYVKHITDSYGYSSSATYDVRFGQKLSTTDMNGQQTQFTVDNAGRILTIRGPFEIASGKPFTIAYEYHPDADVAWAMTKHFDPAHPANFLEMASFRDGIGREVQTKKDIALFSGAQALDQELMVVSGSTTFDAFGRPIVQYYPITEAKGNIGTYNTGADAVNPERMTYDILDRMRTTTLPDNAIVKAEYGFGADRNGMTQFLTKSTDANGIYTENFINARDLLTATKRQYSQGSDVWTSYQYDPVSQLTGVTDDQGNQITMVYDQLGRKITDTHPNAGVTDYKYDLVGNITEKITANLQDGNGGIKYAYDRERLSKITYPLFPQNNVSYTYGTPGEANNRAGRVSKLQDGTGSQEFFYDALGATVKNVRMIKIPDTTSLNFTTQWTYDTWNRLTGMVYPDGEVLTYNYNLGGILQSMSGIKDGITYNYLLQLGYNKFETRVYMRYGNGTEMTYAFEPERRRLNHLTSKTAAGRLMMDNTFTYDKEINILTIQNDAPIPPSNQMGGKSGYQFAYDDLYRMTEAHGTFNGSNHEHRFTQNMAYNSVDAILSKTQVHERKGYDETIWTLQNKTSYNYQYDYNNPDQPHAASHIGRQSFTYDANGNQLGWEDDVSAQNREIVWDEENRVKELSDNGELFRYAYDAGGTRVYKSIGNAQTMSINGKKAAETSGTGNYMIYVNPYEVVHSGGYTKHFYIEGQRIASTLGVNSKSNKKQELFQFYYHPDHIGNSAFVTDKDGEVYQHLEYFPFGETFIDEHSNEQRTPYLYNAKELDDETGLYYYGARYYDPRTSIWQNVDPSWSMPANIDKSPYAYVGNNPAVYSDPDGRNRNYGESNYGRSNYGGGNYGQRNYAQTNYGQSNYAQTNYGQRNYGQNNYGQRNYGGYHAGNAGNDYPGFVNGDVGTDAGGGESAQTPRFVGQHIELPSLEGLSEGSRFRYNNVESTTRLGSNNNNDNNSPGPGPGIDLGELSQVRVAPGEPGARAMPGGSEIHFSGRGQQLAAHEGSHVVQQAHGHITGGVSPRPTPRQQARESKYK